MRTLATINAARAAADLRISDLSAQAEILTRSTSDEHWGPGQQERASRLATALERARADKERLDDEAREAIGAAARDPRAVDGYDPSADRLAGYPSGPTGQVRSEALWAVDRMRSSLSAEAGDRLDRVIRDENDRPALGARYLEAVSRDAYRSAFWRLLRDPQMAAVEMDDNERRALRDVGEIMRERAAWTAGSEGALAVPVTLDPTVILTSRRGREPAPADQPGGHDHRQHLERRRVRGDHRRLRSGVHRGRRRQSDPHPAVRERREGAGVRAVLDRAIRRLRPVRAG